MSKITNDSLTRSDTGYNCNNTATVGVEGLAVVTRPRFKFDLYRRDEGVAINHWPI